MPHVAMLLVLHFQNYRMRKISFRFFLITMIAISVSNLHAQKKDVSNINQYLDFAVAFGNHEGTATFSFVHGWRFSKKKKLEAGFGLRATSYVGSKREFYTAPARLARSTTVPFAIVFAGHEEENLDTLTVQRPFTIAVNLSVNAGYYISERWYAGLNIDLIGFTVGRTTNAILHSDGTPTTEPAAKPAPFNLLLTGDNDYGSLNSEFFVRYHLSKRWAVRSVYQFFFAEYKTQNIKQIAPDGTEVDRFRNKTNLFGIGVSYRL